MPGAACDCVFVMALFVPIGVGQEKVVPTGTTEPLVGVTLKNTPLHLTVVVKEFITGLGSTVTVKLKEVPAQEPDNVVTE